MTADRAFVPTMCPCCGLELSSLSLFPITDAFRVLPPCPDCSMPVCAPCRHHHVKGNNHTPCDRMRVPTS